MAFADSLSGFDGGRATSAAIQIYQNFRSGGAWDAKPYIRKRYGFNGGDYAQAGSVYVRTDVIGNINYGAMLALYGVDEEIALSAANLSGSDIGVTGDPSDDAAVSLGYRMVREYPGGMTQRHYYLFIMNNLDVLATK